MLDSFCAHFSITACIEGRNITKDSTCCTEMINNDDDDDTFNNHWILQLIF